jgi:hypothetical protein
VRLHLEKELMAPSKAFRKHLKSSADLVTTYEAIRAGFVTLALEKNRRATPFVEQARALKALAVQARTPADLIRIVEIQPALLTAAGVSDKALAYLQPEDKVAAIQGLIENFLEPAGSSFVEELVFRFLLTRGDTLGGSMRNIGGALAQRKLTRAMLAALSNAGRAYRWLHSPSNTWLEMTDDDVEIDLQLRGLSWQSGTQTRTLIYNLTVPLVKNNVDLCLFKGRPETITREALAQPHLYLALGELKGGIDPAGADEHWKTARSALNRIRTAFARQGYRPQTFFIGAAIEQKMAAEIWDELQDGTLSNAANLTDDQQIAFVSSWLCRL